MVARVPPLNALKAFEAASRTGSFTLAARDLHVSQGAVSRHVMRLEEYLGVELFDRRKRDIVLTAAGVEFAHDISDAFALIGRATARVASRSTRDDLRVTLFPSIARWVMPRLARFRQDYPNVDLTLSTSPNPANLKRAEADVTNVRSPPVPSGLETYPMFEVVLQPVCAPALAKQLRQLEDLRQVPLLQSVNRPGDWPLWLQTADTSLPRKTRFLRFENSAMMYQAAVDGVGVAMSHIAFVADDLAAGRLVHPFKLTARTGEVYHLAWLPTSAEREGIRVFRDWLAAEIKRSTAARSRRARPTKT